MTAISKLSLRAAKTGLSCQVRFFVTSRSVFQTYSKYSKSSTTSTRPSTSYNKPNSSYTKSTTSYSKPGDASDGTGVSSSDTSVYPSKIDANPNRKVIYEYSDTISKVLGNEVLEAAPTGSRFASQHEINWYSSWHGIGCKPFAKEVQEELAKELQPTDIEIKPDGLIYLPEIKYRRILNRAFGAGGWGLVPRSDTIVTPKMVTREYALVCHGQLVSVARGEQDYFTDTGIPTATEGCKSNALMRCCKDLGIGSELWDPVFIKKFKTTHCVEKFVEHIGTGKKKKIHLRKDRQVEYPYKG